MTIVNAIFASFFTVATLYYVFWGETLNMNFKICQPVIQQFDARYAIERIDSRLLERYQNLAGQYNLLSERLTQQEKATARVSKLFDILIAHLANVTFGFLVFALIAIVYYSHRRYSKPKKSTHNDYVEIKLAKCIQPVPFMTDAQILGYDEPSNDKDTEPSSDDDKSDGEDAEEQESKPLSDNEAEEQDPEPLSDDDDKFIDVRQEESDKEEEEDTDEFNETQEEETVVEMVPLSQAEVKNIVPEFNPLKTEEDKIDVPCSGGFTLEQVMRSVNDWMIPGKVQMTPGGWKRGANAGQFLHKSSCECTHQCA